MVQNKTNKQQKTPHYEQGTLPQEQASVRRARAKQQPKAFKESTLFHLSATVSKLSPTHLKLTAASSLPHTPLNHKHLGWRLSSIEKAHR